VPFANNTELANYIARTLGKGRVAVELTCDQFNDSIADAQRWFIANWGLTKEILINLLPEQNEILMPVDVADVINVYVEQVRIPPLIFDREFPFYFPFPLRAEGGIVFSYPTGLYSSLVQQLQWIEQLKRVFGADISFEYIPELRKLRIYPVPFVSKKALIQYQTNTFAISELALFPAAEDVFVRYSTAKAKYRLGTIRGKFSAFPGAVSDYMLNGPQLIEEAKQELEELNTEVRERNLGSVGFLSE